MEVKGPALLVPNFGFKKMQTGYILEAVRTALDTLNLATKKFS